MSNRYANLTPSKKISEDFHKITEGFDKVQEEMDAKPDGGFTQINDIEAEGSDELTVEGGTGITVTTVPEEKKLRITATGEATPGLHGIEHNHDGADPIPELVQVMEDLASHNNKVFSVWKYGYNGTGAADDAINAAVAAAKTAGGGIVYFPVGNYPITSRIIVDSNYVTLVGADMYLTQITSDINDVMIQIGTFEWDGVTNNWDWSSARYYNGVRNLRLINNATNENAVGIELRGAMRGSYQNIFGDNLSAVFKVRSFNHWNNFNNIASSGCKDTIFITGEGFDGEYNSTGCQYSNIRGMSFKRSVIYATGPTFGDLNISDINGVGTASENPLALIALVSTGAKHYASRITISGVVCDGKAQHVIYGDGVRGVKITNYTRGGSVTNGVTLINGTDNHVDVMSGTFTPTIVGQTTEGVHTYSNQRGYYYLSGRNCKFDITLTLSAKDEAMAGNVVIAGLPFTARNDNIRRTACIIGQLSNVVLDTTRNRMTAVIYANENVIRLLNNGDNVSVSFTQPNSITSTTSIIISGEYEVDI